MCPYIEIRDFRIPTFPFVIILAIFITGVVYITSARYSKAYLLDELKKSIPILVGAAIGGRLTSAITLLPISQNPFWYNLLFGGSVFYGGLIGGCISLAIICSIKKQSFLERTDVIATLLPVGHAIGRFGCFLNGCCYGCKYNGFLSVNYPINGDYDKVFPTWFLEIAFCLLLFLYFQFICKVEIRGIRTATYFVSYSCYRFLTEYLRGDDIRGIWGNFSTSQIMSIFILLAGVIVLIYSCKKKEYNYMIR